MASRKTKKKRAQRASSNIFAMFDQEQIAEFKEAFNLIDYDHDGFISRNDLEETYNSLGMLDIKDAQLEEMIAEAPGSSQLNFTMFLTLFGEKLTGSDPEVTIKQAFECFDEPGLGKINCEALREHLTTMGDRMTEDEVDEIMRGNHLAGDMFDYHAFVKMLKSGTKDDE